MYVKHVFYFHIPAFLNFKHFLKKAPRLNVPVL